MAAEVEFITILAPRARAAYYLAVAEHVFNQCVSDDDPGLSYAVEAVELAWRWVEGARVSGSEIYAHLENEDDVGLGVWGYEARNDGPSAYAAWNTLLFAIAYVIWRAYGGNRRKYLPQTIESVNEDMVEDLFQRAEESGALDHGFVDRVREYLSTRHHGSLENALGGTVSRQALMSLEGSTSRLRSVARQTVDIIETGQYTAPSGRTVDIGKQVTQAVLGTRLRNPGSAGPRAFESRSDQAFEVTGESSLQAARRMLAESPGPVAVLAAISPIPLARGSFHGGRAQEETFHRASALYACLRAVPEFYTAHAAAGYNAFGSDRVIYAPAVPVFRDSQGVLLEEPYAVDFLAAAAPNARAIATDQLARLPDVLSRRVARALEAAAAQNCRRLVLSAWGCGLGNHPTEVAKAFHTHLAPGGSLHGYFSQVVFAIQERGRYSPIHDFHAAFVN